MRMDVWGTPDQNSFTLCEVAERWYAFRRYCGQKGDSRRNFPFKPNAVLPNWFLHSEKEERSKFFENACSDDMLVLIRWHKRKMAVPLSQLTAIDGNQLTKEAIADWHYWISHGHLF